MPKQVKFNMKLLGAFYIFFYCKDLQNSKPGLNFLKQDKYNTMGEKCFSARETSRKKSILINIKSQKKQKSEIMQSQTFTMF